MAKEVRIVEVQNSKVDLLLKLKILALAPNITGIPR